MEKIFLFITINFFFCALIFAQPSFEYIKGEEDKKMRISIAHESLNGNYILPISFEHQGTHGIQFIKLDEDGTTILEQEFSLEFFDLFPIQFFFVEDQIMILAQVHEQVNPLNQLYWVGTFDTDFVFNSEYFFDPLGNGSTVLNDAILENDSTIILFGTADTNIGWKDFASRFSLSSNTFGTFFLENELIFINDIIPRTDSVGYALIGSGIIYTDSFFNVTRYERCEELTTSSQAWLYAYSDSTYLINTRASRYNLGGTIRGMVTGIFDYNFDPINYYGTYSSSPDTIIYPASKQSIDLNEDKEIFVGGTYNVDTNIPFESSNNSAFLLKKYDSDLNELWKNYYGLDSHYYLMSGVIATSDGGCLMYGRQYTEDQKTNAIAIKVNGNGVITNIQTIGTATQNINIFPNPFQGFLTIKNDNRLKRIKIFDVIGNEVFQSFLGNNIQTIDLDYLSSGTYFYSIEQMDGKVFNGKIIKSE